jgi:hypothetical protein
LVEGGGGIGGGDGIGGGSDCGELVGSATPAPVTAAEALDLSSVLLLAHRAGDTNHAYDVFVRPIG